MLSNFISAQMLYIQIFNKSYVSKAAGSYDYWRSLRVRDPSVATLLLKRHYTDKKPSKTNYQIHYNALQFAMRALLPDNFIEKSIFDLRKFIHRSRAVSYTYGLSLYPISMVCLCILSVWSVSVSYLHGLSLYPIYMVCILTWPGYMVLLQCPCCLRVKRLI